MGDPVTPHVGVWIEILLFLLCARLIKVTPHVGVWIEIVQPNVGL